jgi:Zn-finger nucleic acid-binding protein
MTVGGITVDACAGGCGGIWFDRYELMRVDESHESAGEELLNIERDPNLSVDRTKRLRCPKGDDAVMARHFFSAKRRVTVDDCPECGGHWLDRGELSTIRAEYASEADREKAAQEYFFDLFDPRLAAEHAKSEEELARARKFARALRFICPSYYIPGKQECGEPSS